MRYSIFCFFKVSSLFFMVSAVFLWTAVATGCSYVEDDGDGGGAHVTFLDVGQGLSVLLESGARYALFDTGPDSAGFVDTLLAHGIDTLEWVVVSHNHRDHAGGFMEFCGTGKAAVPRVHVRRLFVGPDTSGGFIRDSVLRLAGRLGIPVDTLLREASLELGAEGVVHRMDVLWPPAYLEVGENGASVVLRADFGASSMLLTGDLDSAGERRLLELSPMLNAELMQVGHHGSSGSSSLGFISKVAPRYAVISVGKGNSYGHPANSVVRKLEYVLGDSSRIFRTDRDGSIKFEYVEGVGLISEVQ